MTNTTCNNRPQLRNRHQQIPQIHSNSGFNQFKKPSRCNQKIPFSINSTKRFVPFDSQLCLNFLRGHCHYGENCKFAHVTNDIRNPNLIACKRNIVSGCDQNVMRKNLHDERVCENVAIECRNLDYERVIVHKTKLCMKWLNFGTCPFGVKCIFAHGKAELKYLDSNSLLKFPSPQCKNAVSSEIRTRTDEKLQVNGKRCFVKWDVHKIGRIYADWLDNI